MANKMQLHRHGIFWTQLKKLNQLLAPRPEKLLKAVGKTQLEEALPYAIYLGPMSIYHLSTLAGKENLEKTLRTRRLKVFGSSKKCPHCRSIVAHKGPVLGHA